MKDRTVAVLVLVGTLMTSVCITGCTNYPNRCGNEECGCHDVASMHWGGDIVQNFTGQDLIHKSSFTNDPININLTLGTIKTKGTLAILGDYPANGTTPAHVVYAWVHSGDNDLPEHVKISTNKPLKVSLELSFPNLGDPWLRGREFFNESNNITGDLMITNGTGGIVLTLDRYINGVTVKIVSKASEHGEVDLVVATAEWSFTLKIGTDVLCVG